MRAAWAAKLSYASRKETRTKTHVSKISLGRDNFRFDMQTSQLARYLTIQNVPEVAKSDRVVLLENCVI